MLRSLLLAVPFALGVGPGRAAETTTVTPDQLRALAGQAVVSGSPRTARDMTRALLQRDPGDVEALLIDSRANRDLGEYKPALASARQAWKLARLPERKFAAAMAMAQAQSSAGRRTAAQVWLRRAAQVAPDDRARALVARDYRYLRKVNPLSVHLSFGIAPESNINDGSAHEVVEIEALPGIVLPVRLAGSALPLSGLKISSGIDLRYRVAQTSTAATDLTFAASRNDYVLSSEAKQRAPGVSASEFTFARSTVGLTRRFMSPKSLRETTLSFQGGMTWYGEQHYSNLLRLSFTQSKPVSRVARVSYGAAAERVTGPRAPHADVVQANLGYGTRLGNGGFLSLSARVAKSDSDITSADFREASAGLRYAPPKPVLGTQTSFGLSLRQRHYPTSPHVPGGGARNDREVTASMTMTFDKLDYFGFHPTMTLSASRKTSNADRFDVDNIGLSVGIRSSF
ncbi:MAG: hypothetical protein CSA70_07275 [Rhodobacterales bacterium]|nr:MAG: hypothetical protein CSA70_07275 [Rhodobacterales bacterium]